MPEAKGEETDMKIVLKNLTKKFPSRDKRSHTEVVAVDSFNFEIPDGELVGLLGPSGCGKSTTLNMICGLEKPTEGQIFFGEQDVTALPPENRGVGMVFQNYALYPHLTVRQNIAFPLQNFKGKDKLSKEEINKRVEDAARMVQIEGLLERKPKELSGGQQQRVAIARALVKMPDVLLLDEPLSNLDARLRLQTREEIRRIQKKTGITTVFVTHDQEEAMSISDRIVVMKEGVVQQIGKPQEVYDQPVNLFVAKFLGTPPINVFHGRLEKGWLYLGEEAVLPERSILETGYNSREKERGAESVEANECKAVEKGMQSSEAISEESSASAEACSRKVDESTGREVLVGIRPEGFLLEKDGPFHCSLKRVEVMGRDISILCGNSACEAETIRAIISAEKLPEAASETIAFSLKPGKVFVFDPQTGERIR